MRKNLRSILGVALVVVLSACHRKPSALISVEQDGLRHATFYSKTFVVDQKYRSMAGPKETIDVKLFDPEEPELLWVTGIKTEIDGTDDTKSVSQGFMCHMNVNIDILKHRDRFGWTKNVSQRVFTLSQGGFVIDLPPGYAVPLMSDELLHVTTQVLNLNDDAPMVKVKHKVTLDFYRDSELRKPLIPLFWTSGFAMKSTEKSGTEFGMLPAEAQSRAREAAHGHEPAAAMHEEGCPMGEIAPKDRGKSTVQDTLGQSFTGHWVVKPGHEEVRSNVTKLLNIPFDTKLHFAAVHLHPFATYLELRDMTENKTVFKSFAKGPAKGIGLDHVDYLKSAEGIPMYRDHQYQMVSVYDNPTKEEMDSMATMFLYLEDKEFRKPRR